jgi:penicillin-binding protein 1A
MLPGRGFNVKPIFITRIEDRNGNTLEAFTPKRREVISDLTSFHIINMMKGVVDYGTAKNLKLSYDVSGDIAGKTGTTNENTDAWFMGYTPQLLAGSWVGCDDQFIHFSKENYDGQGARAAMPIWAYFYEKVSHDPNIIGIDPTSTFAKPDIAKQDFGYDDAMGIKPTLGAALEDAGNGTSDQYAPATIPPPSPEEIIPPESNFDLKANKDTKQDADNPYAEPVQQPKPKDEKKPLDLLKNPADKPKPPKAIMPPKSGRK